jgi:diadenosine tetraphosphate (Ap4A) HIT family hydrolase
MAEYDPENIFAKIIEGKIPAFKVYETKHTLAMLDAFPMVEGHTLVLPKTKGSTSLLTMPPREAAQFMGDVQRVAKAVQAATGASAINVWMNCGEDAGQTVFHPHYHIVPRTAGDNLHKYPASAKDMLSKDAAEPMVDKIKLALDPPKPLKKPKFGSVGKINPSSKGLNLKVKLLEDPKETEGGKFFEAKAGDDSGCAIVSLREDQKAGLSAGKTVVIQNGSAKMVKGHIRIAVDKWGKIDMSSEEFTGEVNTAKDLSATEYELVK